MRVRSAVASPGVVDAAIAVVYAAFFLGYTLILVGPKVLGLPWHGRAAPVTGLLAVNFQIELLSLSSILLVVACAVALALRRVRPRASFIVIVLIAAAQAAIGEPISFWNVAMLASLFSVAAYSGRAFSRAALLVVGIGYFAILVQGSGLLERLTNLPDPVRVLASPRGAVAVAVLGLLVMIWALGDQVRAGRERLELERERAIQADRERDARAQLGALAERHQIARELHDVVAHGLAVVVVQADGALYASAEHPDAPRRALEAIATTGRQALTEMRRLLGVLRDSSDPAQFAPQPGIGSIDDLVEAFRRAGLPVEVIAEVALPDVPPATGLAAYRIVQESLTNVLRHAGRVPTRVTLRDSAGDVAIDVENDPGEQHAPVDAPPGLGLTGMRERVALLEGSLTAGPTPQGGFAVHVRIPHTREKRVAGA